MASSPFHDGISLIIIDDHVPKMVGDTPWAHRGRAWSTGYIAGMLAAVTGSSPKSAPKSGTTHDRNSTAAPSRTETIT